MSHSSVNRPLAAGQPPVLTSASRWMCCVLIGLYVGLHLAGTAGHAANTYFMPGDAFFHSRLTEDVIDDLVNGNGAATFRYDRPGPSTFSGYAGFPNLTIEGLDPESRKWLKALYERLRMQYPQHIRVTKIEVGDRIDVVAKEINGFHLLIYGRDFDVRRFRIGLKYNEEWHSPPPTAVGPTLFLGPVRSYDPFVKSYEAVVEDWKSASDVPGLPVELPKDALWARHGPKIEAPVTARAEDVRFLVFPAGSLDAHFRRRNTEEFWEVTPSGIKAYTWKRGELISGEWESDVGESGATENGEGELP